MATIRRYPRRFNQRSGRTVAATREREIASEVIARTIDNEFSKRITRRYEARDFQMTCTFHFDAETKTSYVVRLVYDVRNVVKGRYRLVQIVVAGRRIKNRAEIEKWLPGYTIEQAERAFWGWWHNV